MSLSPQFIDDVRSRTTLSTLIGRSVKLTKAGKEYKACCPFHNEKTPSFTVNDDKGFYHCFGGCGAHGNAFDWMTRTKGLGFIDAVRELAEGAGLVMPERSPEAAAKAQRILGLRPVLEGAQALFVGNLAVGGDVHAYLTGRGLSDALIAEFGLGWAPPGGCLTGHGFGKRAMMEAGLIGESDTGFTYERFKSRITIPVHDGRGRIIGFGGRLFEGEGAPSAKSKSPKYVNSPGSEIFDKGRTLYNLHRAREAAAKAKRIIVVEGYMDVIALAGAGVGEAVAPMGTALTPEQLELLWRLHHRPILLFDGDSAGQKAALRACETALPMIGPARELAVAIMPAGIDPDDMVKKQGIDALEAVIGAAKPCHDFVFEAVAGVACAPVGVADHISDAREMVAA